MEYEPGPIEQRLMKSDSEMQRRLCTLSVSELFDFMEWLTILPDKAWETQAVEDFFNMAEDLAAEKASDNSDGEYACKALLRIITRLDERLGDYYDPEEDDDGDDDQAGW